MELWLLFEIRNEKQFEHSEKTSGLITTTEHVFRTKTNKQLLGTFFISKEKVGNSHLCERWIKHTDFILSIYSMISWNCRLINLHHYRLKVPSTELCVWLKTIRNCGSGEWKSEFKLDLYMRVKLHPRTPNNEVFFFANAMVSGRERMKLIPIINIFTNRP